MSTELRLVPPVAAAVPVSRTFLAEPPVARCPCTCLSHSFRVVLVALTVAAAIVRNAAPTPALAAPNEAASPVTDLVRQTAGHGQLIGEISWVPPGAVRLGQAGIAWAEPVHEVLVDGFYIDRHEVSNGSYQAFIDAGGYTVASCWNPVGWAWREERGITRPANWTDARYHGGGIAGNERFPVSGVSWWEADAFCRWAGGRLPTEAEWEKAARGANDTRAYPWGDAAPTCTLANGYVDGYCVGDTSAVGSYAMGSSPYGAVDMAGNVWDWVNDWYDESYYVGSPGSSPPGPAAGTDKVLRGGAWYVGSTGLRTVTRYLAAPTTQGHYIGFRCAVSEAPAP